LPPGPTGGAYSAPVDPPAKFKGPTLGEERGRERAKKRAIFSPQYLSQVGASEERSKSRAARKIKPIMRHKNNVAQEALLSWRSL